MTRKTRETIFWAVVLGIPFIAANYYAIPHIHDAFQSSAAATSANVFTYLLVLLEGLVGGCVAVFVLVAAICILFSSAYEWFVDGKAPHWYIRRQAKKTDEKRLRITNKQRIANDLSKRADTDIHRMVEATSELREAEAELEEFLATKGHQQ